MNFKSIFGRLTRFSVLGFDVSWSLPTADEDGANPRRPRTSAETTDPVERGAEGGKGRRVGYTRSGDKVEWAPDQEKRPLLLRRNDKTILKAYNELWDKVWWNRLQAWLEMIKLVAQPLTKTQVPILKKAMQAAKRIEKKYGAKNLGWDDFNWGLMSGRMSALAWVLGAEWDVSLDT